MISYSRILLICLFLSGTGCVTQSGLIDYKSHLIAEKHKQKLRCQTTSLRSIPCKVYTGPEVEAILNDYMRMTSFGPNTH